MPAKSKTVSKKRGATIPIREFKDQKAWGSWLAKNHTAAEGIWMRLAKKASGKKSISHAEALEVALCYGWIDALALAESETAWLQRFMPRAKKSLWSKINREKALALIATGRMTPAGLSEVERAKEDGRWEAAYEPASTAKVPDDLKDALSKSPRANECFRTLNATNRYAILWRLQTAKRAETRAKRIRTFVEMLEKGETIH